MKKFYTVPLGCSTCDKFCDELEQLEPGTGVLVLPSRVLMQKVRRSSNVQCMGMDSLASKILNINGYVHFELINRRSQEILIQERIEAVEKELKYFHTLAEKQGFVKAMTSLVGQLSRTGATEQEIYDILVNWRELVADSDGEQAASAKKKKVDIAQQATGRSGNLGLKDKEVAYIYLLYRDYLKKNKMFDLEGKFRLALAILRKADVKLSYKDVKLPYKKVYFSDFSSFDNLQMEFIKELGRHCDVIVGMPYETERPDIFATSTSTFNGLLSDFGADEHLQLVKEGSPTLQHLAQHLGQNGPAKDAEGLKVLCFSNREDEMRYVLTAVKQLLQKGVNQDEIAMGLRDFSNYSGLRRLADEYGVPISLPKSASLAIQPLTEFVTLLLQAVPDTRDGATAYFALLSSEFGKQLFDIDMEQTDALRVDKFYSKRSRVQEDVRKLLAKQGYQLPDKSVGDNVDVVFDDEEDSISAEAEAVFAPMNEGTAACLRNLQLVNELLDTLPLKGSVSLYVQQLLAFLDELQLQERLGKAYQKGQLALEALQCALGTVRELENCLGMLEQDYAACKHENDALTLSEWRQLLADAVEPMNFRIGMSRANGVLVTEAINLQGTSFKHLFMLGLREGEFPRGNNENWIYNDKERGELASMGLELLGTTASYLEDAFFFAAAVTCSTETLTLTYHKDDEADASPYIDDVCKLFNNVDRPKEAGKLQKDYASPVELEQLGHEVAAEWLEQRLGKAALTATAVDAERKAATAVDADGNAGTSIFNGLLDDEKLADQVRTAVGDTFSASALELYAQCPFRYLAEKVWKLSDDGEKGETAEAADLGSILHAVLADFMSGHLNEKLTYKEPQVLEDELRASFEKIVSKYIDGGSIIDNELWALEKPQLWQLLLNWLEYEKLEQQDWESYRPVAAEWSFDKKYGTALTLPLEDGSTIKLRGRVDRVDSDGTHIFITDYKRSDASAPTKNELLQGLDLQLPVYMLAAKEGMDKPVSGGGYFVLRKSTRKSTLDFGELNNPFVGKSRTKSEILEQWEQFEPYCRNIIKSYAEGIYHGQFSVAPKKCSPFCPLSDICRLGALAVAEKVEQKEQGGEENG